VPAEGCIDGVTGDVGGGKSYYVVSEGIRHLSRGGVWATNIDVKVDRWYSERYKRHYAGCRHILRDLFGWELQVGQIITLPPDCWDYVHELLPESLPDYPVLCTLDEALEGYDSLDRGESGKRLRSVLSFVRHCRKYSVNLQYLVQTMEELNNRIRSKLTNIVYTRDTDKMRVPFLRIPYPIRGCFLVQHYRKSFTGFPHKQAHIPKAKWVYDCYDTGEKALASSGCGLGMVNDFRGKGTVDDMTKPQRIGLYSAVVCSAASLAFTGYSFLGHSNGLTPTQIADLLKSRPQLVASSATNDVSETIFVPWTAVVTASSGDPESVLVGGLWCRVGSCTPYGDVRVITSDIIICQKGVKTVYLVRVARQKSVTSSGQTSIQRSSGGLG